MKTKTPAQEKQKKLCEKRGKALKKQRVVILSFLPRQTFLRQFP